MKKKHIVLAMETGVGEGSISLFENSREVDFAVGNSNAARSEGLLPMIKEVLDRKSLKAEDIELVAASKGPGSFTGIRIGISVAKALALGIGCYCIGVNTLEAMAVSIKREGKIRSVLTIGRDEVIFQDFFYEQSLKIKKLSEMQTTPIRKLFEWGQLNDLSAIVCNKILHSSDEYNDMPFETYLPTPFLARYVGLLALEKVKTNEIEPLEPVYARSFEIGR